MVVFAIGFFSVPHVFAETDDDTILFTDPGGWTIELPSDGSWIRGSTETVVFQTWNGESIIRILYLTFLTDRSFAEAFGEGTDRDILNAIKLRNVTYCSDYYWYVNDFPFDWYGCFKFQDLGT